MAIMGNERVLNNQSLLNFAGANNSSPLSAIRKRNDDGSMTLAGRLTEANRLMRKGKTNRANAEFDSLTRHLADPASPYYKPYYIGANAGQDGDEDFTRGMEGDLSAMQDAVSALVNKGYSDKDIVNRVHSGDYRFLKQASDEAGAGAARKLTRPVGYLGEDTIYAQINLARKGGEGDALEQFASYSQTDGAQDMDDQSEASYDPSSDVYNPYSHGSTFWGGTKEEEDDARQNSANAAQELESITQWAQEQIDAGYSANQVYAYLSSISEGGDKTFFEENYPTLSRMELYRTGGKALALYDAVNFAMPYFYQTLKDMEAKRDGGKAEQLMPDEDQVKGIPQYQLYSPTRYKQNGDFAVELADYMAGNKVDDPEFREWVQKYPELFAQDPGEKAKAANRSETNLNKDTGERDAKLKAAGDYILTGEWEVSDDWTDKYYEGNRLGKKGYEKLVSPLRELYSDGALTKDQFASYMQMVGEFMEYADSLGVTYDQLVHGNFDDSGLSPEQQVECFRMKESARKLEKMIEGGLETKDQMAAYNKLEQYETYAEVFTKALNGGTLEDYEKPLMDRISQTDISQIKEDDDEGYAKASNDLISYAQKFVEENTEFAIDETGSNNDTLSHAVAQAVSADAQSYVDEIMKFASMMGVPFDEAITFLDIDLDTLYKNAVSYAMNDYADGYNELKSALYDVFLYDEEDNKKEPVFNIDDNAEDIANLYDSTGTASYTRALDKAFAEEFGYDLDDHDLSVIEQMFVQNNLEKAKENYDAQLAAANEETKPDVRKRMIDDAEAEWDSQLKDALDENEYERYKQYLYLQNTMGKLAKDQSNEAMYGMSVLSAPVIGEENEASIKSYYADLLQREKEWERGYTLSGQEVPEEKPDTDWNPFFTVTGGVGKGVHMHIQGWEKVGFFLARKDWNTQENDLRYSYYSPEDARAYFQQQIDKVTNAGLRERLQYQLDNYTGDIYRFQFSTDAIGLQSAIAGNQDKIDAIDAEAREVLSPTGRYILDGTATAVNSMLLMAETLPIKMALTGMGCPPQIADIVGLTVTFGSTEGLGEMGNELLDEGKSKAEAWMKGSTYAVVTGCVEALAEGVTKDYMRTNGTMAHAAQQNYVAQTIGAWLKGKGHPHIAKLAMLAADMAVGIGTSAVSSIKDIPSEVAQEILEDALSKGIKNFDIDNPSDFINHLPTLEEVKDTAITTAISTPIQGIAGGAAGKVKDSISNRTGRQSKLAAQGMMNQLASEQEQYQQERAKIEDATQKEYAERVIDQSTDAELVRKANEQLAAMDEKGREMEVEQIAFELMGDEMLALHNEYAAQEEEIARKIQENEAAIPVAEQHVSDTQKTLADMEKEVASAEMPTREQSQQYALAYNNNENAQAALSKLRGENQELAAKQEELKKRKQQKAKEIYQRATEEAQREQIKLAHERQKALDAAKQEELRKLENYHSSEQQRIIEQAANTPLVDRKGNLLTDTEGDIRLVRPWAITEAWEDFKALDEQAFKDYQSTLIQEQMALADLFRTTWQGYDVVYENVDEVETDHDKKRITLPIGATITELVKQVTSEEIVRMAEEKGGTAYADFAEALTEAMYGDDTGYERLEKDLADVRARMKNGVSEYKVMRQLIFEKAQEFLFDTESGINWYTVLKGKNRIFSYDVHDWLVLRGARLENALNMIGSSAEGKRAIDLLKNIREKFYKAMDTSIAEAEATNDRVISTSEDKRTDVQKILDGDYLALNKNGILPVLIKTEDGIALPSYVKKVNQKVQKIIDGILAEYEATKDESVIDRYNNAAIESSYIEADGTKEEYAKRMLGMNPGKRLAERKAQEETASEEQAAEDETDINALWAAATKEKESPAVETATETEQAETIAEAPATEAEQAETIAEEAATEEAAQAEETVQEAAQEAESPAAETAAEETTAEETAVEETAATEETAAGETAAEETATEETATEEAAAEEAPAETTEADKAEEEKAAKKQRHWIDRLTDALPYRVQEMLGFVQETLDRKSYATMSGRLLGKLLGKFVKPGNRLVSNPVNTLRLLANEVGSHIYENISSGETFEEFDTDVLSNYIDRSNAIFKGGDDAVTFAKSMYGIAESVKKKLGDFTWDKTKTDFGTLFYLYMVADDAFMGKLGLTESAKNLQEAIAKTGFGEALEHRRNQLHYWIKGMTRDERMLSYMRRYGDRKESYGVQGKLGNFRTEWADQYNVAKYVDRYVRQQTGEKSNAFQRAAYMHTDRSKLADEWLQGTPRDLDFKALGVKSINQIIQEAKITKGERQLFEAYMMARTMVDRAANGKEAFAPLAMQMVASGYFTLAPTLKDINAYIAKANDEHPNFDKAARGIYRTWNAFMQNVWVGEGMMTEKTYQDMKRKNPNYVPLKRYEEGDTNVYYAKGGSNAQVINPIEMMGVNLTKMLRAASQNRIKQEFDRIFQNTPGMGAWAATVNEGELSDEELAVSGRDDDVITVNRKDGTKVQYTIADKGLLNMLKATMESRVAQSINGKGFYRMMQRVTNLVSKMSTTWNPLFSVVRNPVRDFQTGVNWGSYATNYVTGGLKLANATYDVMKEYFGGKGSEVVKDFFAMGGKGYTRADTENRRKLGNDIRGKIYEQDSVLKKIGRIPVRLMTLEDLASVMETANRFVEYKFGKESVGTAEGKGGKVASWLVKLGGNQKGPVTQESKENARLNSREVTVDFSRKGNGLPLNAIRTCIPFFNATIQGIDRTARMFSQEERDRLAPRLIKSIINPAVTGLLSSMLCLGVFKKDKDKDDLELIQKYLEASDDVKANNILLPWFFGGEREVLRFPVAQDALIHYFYEMGRKLGEDVFKGNYEDLNHTPFLQDMLDMVWTATLGQVFDTSLIFNAVVDAANNKSYFGSDIVSGFVSQAPNTHQANIYTPNFYKGAANVINAAAGWIPGVNKTTLFNVATNPMKLEYLVEQYTGAAGAAFKQAFRPNPETGKTDMASFLRGIVRYFRNGVTLDLDDSSDIEDLFNDWGTAINEYKSDTYYGFGTGRFDPSADLETMDEWLNKATKDFAGRRGELAELEYQIQRRYGSKYYGALKKIAPGPLSEDEVNAIYGATDKEVLFDVGYNITQAELEQLMETYVDDAVNKLQKQYIALCDKNLSPYMGTDQTAALVKAQAEGMSDTLFGMDAETVAEAVQQGRKQLAQEEQAEEQGGESRTESKPVTGGTNTQYVPVERKPWERTAQETAEEEPVEDERLPFEPENMGEDEYIEPEGESDYVSDYQLPESIRATYNPKRNVQTIDTGDVGGQGTQAPETAQQGAYAPEQNIQTAQTFNEPARRSYGGTLGRSLGEMTDEEIMASLEQHRDELLARQEMRRQRQEELAAMPEAAYEYAPEPEIASEPILEPAMEEPPKPTAAVRDVTGNAYRDQLPPDFYEDFDNGEGYLVMAQRVAELAPKSDKQLIPNVDYTFKIDGIDYDIDAYEAKYPGIAREYEQWYKDAYKERASAVYTEDWMERYEAADDITRADMLQKAKNIQKNTRTSIQRKFAKWAKEHPLN